MARLDRVYSLNGASAIWVCLVEDELDRHLRMQFRGIEKWQRHISRFNNQWELASEAMQAKRWLQCQPRSYMHSPRLRGDRNRLVAAHLRRLRTGPTGLQAPVGSGVPGVAVS